MLDNTKFSVTDTQMINRMLLHPDFVVCKPKTNYYHSLKHKDFGVILSLDFRKAVENGKVVGYGYLEINVSPHYHFNQYRHNGNDFTPENSIKTVFDILTYLGIEPQEYDRLKVVNIEFGINIIPETNIKNLINGILFHKKTVFKTGIFPYFKKTEATSYKQIKAYAKGLQFLEFPHYKIDPNTFRFEVKSKQAKNITKYAIRTADDLIKTNTYKTLNQTLLDEWENVLIINQNPNLSHLKTTEIEFIQRANKIDFWKDLIDPKNRNKFSRYKEKYYRILASENNLHHLIKLQIIDKLISFQSGANSTQENSITSEEIKTDQTDPNRINLEFAPLPINNSNCLVTGLDISMQKKGSKYLCYSGLKYYKENDPQIYLHLEKLYLTKKMKLRDIDSQIYYIAHNIRNRKTNEVHNRERFENRNYSKQQLQLNFNNI